MPVMADATSSSAAELSLRSLMVTTVRSGSASLSTTMRPLSKRFAESVCKPTCSSVRVLETPHSHPNEVYTASACLSSGPLPYLYPDGLH